MKTSTTAKFAVLYMAILFSGAAQANIVGLGQITLTGNFTLDHNFDFNNPDATPYGTFGTLMVQSTTGIFVPYVAGGDTLSMNTPLVYVSSGSDPIVLPNGKIVFGSLPAPMQWSIGGFTINTLWDVITGDDIAGQDVTGLGDLSGNGFDPSAYGSGAILSWHFTAPPYDISNFHMDITGPITLQIGVGYDNGHVPETGATVRLLCMGLFGLFCTRRLVPLQR